MTSRLADRMVFVVGAPRSGTTWLQRMIASHPDVLALPSETHLFTWGMSVLQEQTQGGLVGSPSTGVAFLPAPEFAAAARAFCDTYFGAYVDRVRPDAPRVLERSPTHVWHLDLIGAVYPDAWVVHIVRDGRDVVRSLVAHAWGPAEVETAAREWASAIRAARAAAPELPRYLEVSYERLLTTPDDVGDVFEFLHLPSTGGSVESALREGRRAINVDPTRPDVATGKWRTEWSAHDVAAFDRGAGDLWRELGFDTGETEPTPVATPQADLRRPTQRGLLRRPRIGDRSATGEPVSTGLNGEGAQRQLDRLMTALATGDTGDAVDVLGDQPVVFELVDGDRRVRASGAAEIVDLVLADGAWGEPVLGEQHIDGRSWTVVLGHTSGGTLTHRVVVASFDASLQRIAELRCFVLRPGAAVPA